MYTPLDRPPAAHSCIDCHTSVDSSCGELPGPDALLSSSSVLPLAAIIPGLTEPHASRPMPVDVVVAVAVVVAVGCTDAAAAVPLPIIILGVGGVAVAGRTPYVGT